MSNLPTTTQPDLFAPGELPAGWEILPEYQHRFTAERVAQNEARYRAIVRALAEGLSIRQIARAFAVSGHTVCAIREREPDLVAAEKVSLSRVALRGARMSIEAYVDAVERDKVPPNVLAIGAGILAEKSLLLMGEATTICAQKGADVRREDVEGYLRSLPSASGVPSATGVGSSSAGAPGEAAHAGATGVNPARVGATGEPGAVGPAARCSSPAGESDSGAAVVEVAVAQGGDAHQKGLDTCLDTLPSAGATGEPGLPGRSSSAGGPGGPGLPGRSSSAGGPGGPGLPGRSSSAGATGEPGLPGRSSSGEPAAGEPGGRSSSAGGAGAIRERAAGAAGAGAVGGGGARRARGGTPR